MSAKLHFKRIRNRMHPAISIAILLAYSLLVIDHVESADDDRQKLIEKVRSSVLTIRVQGRDGDEMGVGTGFVIDHEGLIATNFHVIGEGRMFTVKTVDGDELKVKAVEASNVTQDLALIRVERGDVNLKALPLAVDVEPHQGSRVLAFGNPHGLENSVVEGIVSAKRQIEGRELIQLAMPIDPGNSGGPLVDTNGSVLGIVNMKSAIDENLGFAIPVQSLEELIENPNPISIERWVRIGKINTEHWSPVFGAVWEQRGGKIQAVGQGNSFGGRALLLSNESAPELPFEVAVNVKLNDESGAAGLCFHSDGKDRHYGFYPSNGKLRLTCFKGPSVYSWEILAEVASDAYLPEHWNRLRVKCDKNQLQCFVNEELVIESNDKQLTQGKVGLAAFRGTKAEFRHFQFGKQIDTPRLSDLARESLQALQTPNTPIDSIDSKRLDDLGESGELASRALVRRALELENQAVKLRQLASDVRRAKTIRLLGKLVESEAPMRLLRGTLLIAALDQPELDVEAYVARIDQMASEIQKRLGDKATETEKRDELHQYLFAENGFHGSRTEYYHPANSHLNRVIDDREGLPITMSILYMELAKRLGMAIEGVGLPGHFVVRHVIDKNQSQLVDVFERGQLMSDADAKQIVLMHTRREMRDSDLAANSDLEILTRVLNNLIGIAGRNNDGEAMLKYVDAVVAINPESTQFRTMRAQLRGMTGRIGFALEDVDALLRDDPDDLNRPLVQRLREALLERQ